MTTVDPPAPTEVSHATAPQASDDHGHGHEKARYDDLNMPAIFVASFISMVLTFVCICGAQALYYYWNNREILTKEHEIVRTPQLEIVENQQEKLEEYSWSETGTVIVPIEKAMQITLDKYKTPTAEQNN